MPIALILADDLTGAADAGVQFASHGWRTLLVLDPSGMGGADVLSISTDSRTLPSAADAGQAVSRILSTLHAQPAYTNLLPSSGCEALPGFRLVYKKMDSTLRGYPAAELAALLATLGETRALIAPAFPSQGRTTRGGVQYLNGQPLDRSSFTSEIATSNLLDLFGSGQPAAAGPDALTPALLPLQVVRQGQVAAGNALRQARGLLIADAETDSDLQTLARATLAEGLRVCCGSAGLAAALVECLAAPAATPLLCFSPTPGPILAVAGSLNPATLAQLDYAARQGVTIVRPSSDFYQDTGETRISETAARVATELAAGGPVVLAAPLPAPVDFLSPEEGERRKREDAVSPDRAQISFVTRLAWVISTALENRMPGGLFLTGGDTARAVCAVMDCTRIWLGGQIEPGIPWGILADGRFPGLPVVTKAGGFGIDRTLFNAIQFLQGK